MLTHGSNVSVALFLTVASGCSVVETDAVKAKPDEVRALPEAADDMARDVLSTNLELDLESRKAKATIRVAASNKPGLSFEVGDLVIESVTSNGVALDHKVVDQTAPPRRKTQRLDVGVPVSDDASEIVVTYGFQDHADFDGWMSGSEESFLWPYFSSNLFPCHSAPADGSTFTLKVTGIRAGETAVYPETIAFEAPTYMPAIAVGRFNYTELGATRKGTHVGVYSLGRASPEVSAATSKMVDIFDWYEATIGDYKFGDKVASVQVDWGLGAFGGMEHHPFWHVGTASMASEETHAHEAAHGWYGNGVRIRCWEDFVLSEGTASYLAARAIQATHGTTAGDAIWASYRSKLGQAISDADTRAWPQTCNAIDILHDPLWSNVPYMKGAFFYRKVAEQIGVEKMDAILAGFYKDNVGRAAGMGDMIARIQEETTFDPQPLVDTWLKGLGAPL